MRDLHMQAWVCNVSTQCDLLFIHLLLAC